MAEKDKKQKKDKAKGKGKGKASKEVAPPERPAKTPYSRLWKRYREEIRPSLVKEFSFSNEWESPRLEKVVINMGVGEGARDIKILEAAIVDLTVIAGQKPMMTRAHTSQAAYKIRTGMPVGTSVTLRGNRMYEFLDKLFNIALPRVRDFQGLNPNSFDGSGNFTFGIKEQLVFPEIDYDEIDRVRGMDITIVTTAKNDKHAASLLKELGCPFKREAGK